MLINDAGDAGSDGDEREDKEEDGDTEHGDGDNGRCIFGLGISAFATNLWQNFRAHNLGTMPKPRTQNQYKMLRPSKLENRPISRHQNVLNIKLSAHVLARTPSYFSATDCEGICKRPSHFLHPRLPSRSTWPRRKETPG